MIALPRVSGAGTLDHVPTGPEHQTSQDAKRPMLVVDDNDDAAQMLALLLQTMGYEVDVANTARGGLKLAQEISPAILFLDIGLPDMDGYELAKQFRELKETSSSKLIAVTGYGQPEDKAKALAAGFDHHMVKPVKMALVLKLIEELDS